MSNILITTMPAPDHVNPMLAIARKLVECGHTVRWYYAKPFAEKIQADGTMLIEIHALPKRGQSNGNKPMVRFLGRLGFDGTMIDWKNTFIDPIEDQARDLDAALDAQGA